MKMVVFRDENMKDENLKDQNLKDDNFFLKKCSNQICGALGAGFGLGTDLCSMLQCWREGGGLGQVSTDG